MSKIAKELDRIIKLLPTQLYYSKTDAKELYDLISKEDKYSIFINFCHQLGASSGKCINSIEEFFNILLNRTKKVGSTQALQEVDEYLEMKEFSLQCGLLFYGIHIDFDYNFSNGVSLVRLGSLKDSRLANFLAKEDMLTGGIFSSVLIVDYLTSKEITSSIDSKPKNDWSKIDSKTALIKILEDTRLILALCKPHNEGIPVVGTVEIVPDKLHFITNGVSFGFYPEPRNSINPSIIEIEARQAETLILKFNSFEEKVKDKLRIAMKRLNDSKIDSNWANKCINLRICLENLFLTEVETSEIKKKLSERVPNYTNLSKRRVKNIYSFLSSAVHTGLTPKHPNITEEEIRMELRKVIIQFINEGGYPVWSIK